MVQHYYVTDRESSRTNLEVDFVDVVRRMENRWPRGVVSVVLDRCPWSRKWAKKLLRLCDARDP